MPYTVIPAPGAEDALAWIWLFASDRRAVSAASNIIDRILKQAPLSFGQPRGLNRVLRAWPLSVLYRVSEDDQIVNVLDYMYHG